MVAPHSGIWMIEISYDHEVHNPHFVAEQNEIVLANYVA